MSQVARSKEARIVARMAASHAPAPPYKIRRHIREQQAAADARYLWLAKLAEGYSLALAPTDGVH